MNCSGPMIPLPGSSLPLFCTAMPSTRAMTPRRKYTDAAQAGSWAVEAIRWANAEGLVTGTSAATLTPKGSATRAQAAMILTRFCQRVAT